MATMLERPTSALNNTPNATILPRRDSIEIIDVDAIESPPNTQASSSSSQQQRRRPVPRQRVSRDTQSDIISLADTSSDDDFEILATRVLPGHGVDRSRSHRRLISPHPNFPSGSSNPPPVPPIPPRFAGHAAFPVRRDGTTFSTPPISANSRPFDFEQSPEAVEIPAAGPSNYHQHQHPSANEGAPRSRPVPSLGFGGALLSSNRVAPIRRPRLHAAAASSVPFNRRRGPQVRNARNNFDPMNWLINGDDILPHINTLFGLTTYDPDYLHLRGQTQSTREKEQYQQHYTHPAQPEPGFTFDFAPPSPEDDPQDVLPSNRFFPPTSIDEPIVLDDDEDEKGKKRKPHSSSSSFGQPTEPSSKKLNASLVCASCLDPLLLNAGLRSDESQDRRVWGLRCGHLIDEKCLNKLGKPEEPIEDNRVEAESQHTGKTKNRKTTKDRKGKGKAQAVTISTPVHAEEHPQPPLSPEVPLSTDNSIRSRLRSSASFIVSSLPSFSPFGASPSSTAIDSTTDTSTFTPPNKRRRASRKKPNKIEATYEWRCPVANCGRMHVSIKVNGVWGPEKERSAKGVKGLQEEARGAIAIFA